MIELARLQDIATTVADNVAGFQHINWNMRDSTITELPAFLIDQQTSNVRYITPTELIGKVEFIAKFVMLFRLPRYHDEFNAGATDATINDVYTVLLNTDNYVADYEMIDIVQDSIIYDEHGAKDKIGIETQIRYKYKVDLYNIEDLKLKWKGVLLRWNQLVSQSYKSIITTGVI